MNIYMYTGEEITLEYKFKVDTELEPEKFRMAHTVFYETDKVAYSTTFFNQVFMCICTYIHIYKHAYTLMYVYIYIPPEQN
jgi:hypothetical protein